MEKGKRWIYLIDSAAIYIFFEHLFYFRNVFESIVFYYLVFYKYQALKNWFYRSIFA